MVPTRSGSRHSGARRRSAPSPARRSARADRCRSRMNCRPPRRARPRGSSIARTAPCRRDRRGRCGCRHGRRTPGRAGRSAAAQRDGQRGSPPLRAGQDRPAGENTYDIQVRYIAVPDDWAPPKPGLFEKETMNALADMGERMGADPASWQSALPSCRNSGYGEAFFHNFFITLLLRFRLGRHGISHRTRLQSKGQTGPASPQILHPLHQRSDMPTADLKAFGVSRSRSVRLPAKGNRDAVHPSAASARGRRPRLALAGNRRCPG